MLNDVKQSLYKKCMFLFITGVSIVCSKKTLKLLVTGLYAWISPVTGEFPAQKASNAENVSIWWRHHDKSFNVQQWDLST